MGVVVNRATKKQLIDAARFGVVAGLTWAVVDTIVAKVRSKVGPLKISGALDGFLDDAKDLAQNIYDGVVGTEVVSLTKDADKKPPNEGA